MRVMIELLWRERPGFKAANELRDLFAGSIGP
jgi:hypothetical protein